MFTNERKAHHLRNLERFGTQHCRLIGQSDTLQMVVRVEPIRCSFSKLVEEFFPTTAFRYVVADGGGLVLVSYDQVMSTGMQGGPGKRRARLFVLEFAWMIEVIPSAA